MRFRYTGAFVRRPSKAEFDRGWSGEQRIFRFVAAISLVDTGTLDDSAGELLGGFNDGPGCGGHTGCSAAPWRAASAGRPGAGVRGDDQGLDADQ